VTSEIKAELKEEFDQEIEELREEKEEKIADLEEKKQELEEEVERFREEYEDSHGAKKEHDDGVAEHILERMQVRQERVLRHFFFQFWGGISRRLLPPGNQRYRPPELELHSQRGRVSFGVRLDLKMAHTRWQKQNNEQPGEVPPGHSPTLSREVACGFRARLEADVRKHQTLPDDFAVTWKVAERNSGGGEAPTCIVCGVDLTETGPCCEAPRPCRGDLLFHCHCHYVTQSAKETGTGLRTQIELRTSVDQGSSCLHGQDPDWARDQLREKLQELQRTERRIEIPTAASGPLTVERLEWFPLHASARDTLEEAPASLGAVHEAGLQQEKKWRQEAQRRAERAADQIERLEEELASLREEAPSTGRSGSRHLSGEGWEDKLKSEFKKRFHDHEIQLAQTVNELKQEKRRNRIGAARYLCHLLQRHIMGPGPARGTPGRALGTMMAGFKKHRLRELRQRARMRV